MNGKLRAKMDAGAPRIEANRPNSRDGKLDAKPCHDPAGISRSSGIIAIITNIPREIDRKSFLRHNLG